MPDSQPLSLDQRESDKLSLPIASPTLEVFEALAASSRYLPVCVTMPCDTFSPPDVLEAMSPGLVGFIVDGASPEPGASRYAYVGIGDERLAGHGEAIDGNPFDALRSLLAEIGSPIAEGLPPFITGVVGYVAYEAVRHIEPSVGRLHPDPVGVPEAAFIVPDEMIAFDREQRTATAVVLADSHRENLSMAYGGAVRRCQELLELLGQCKPSSQAISTEVMGSRGISYVDGQRSLAFGELGTKTLVPRSEYEGRVEAAREAIIDGELIQVVLSQRLERPTEARPLDVYRELADLNPSTYMFYLGFGSTRSTPNGFNVIGASPELMTRVRNGVASVHPIAGTRPRSPTGEHDADIEAELLASEKERAEHIMLVDLARNDLGRVCEPATVEVPYLMRTERCSHVVHLVSRVRGRLRADCDGISAFEAGFPIGTLAGAPKIRAMQLISELESEGRGPYCGGVGWFGANGDMDTGTVIRSIVFKDGVAHVQGGGGIVFDSDPAAEYEESVNKMTAQLEAIATAEDRKMFNPIEERWRSPVESHA